MKLIKCRACGGSIFFAPTAAGKSVPLDAEPAANGNYRICDDGIARVVKKDEAPSYSSLFISHFATCPDAQRFRKKGA